MIWCDGQKEMTEELDDPVGYLANGQGRASQNKVSAKERPTESKKIDSPPFAWISVRNHLNRKSKKGQNLQTNRNQA